MSLPRFPVDQWTVDLFRRVFMSTADGRTAFALLQRELGHFSADPGNDVERGQQEYSRRLWRLCGIMYPNNTRAIVDALFDHVVPTWDEADRATKREARRVAQE
jgi:hypothetical protein